VPKRHPDLLFDPDTDTDPDPDFIRFLCLSLAANVALLGRRVSDVPSEGVFGAPMIPAIPHF
jgi:hypothetical protein